MNFFAYMVLLGYVPAVLVAAVVFGARRAVIWGTVLGFLFLPQRGITLPGFPDFSREFAMGSAVFATILLLDLPTLARTPLRALDAVVVVLCLSPFVSSITNDLGPYDGLSTALSQTMLWGAPYLAGRVYCGNPAGMQMLVRALLVGAIIYTILAMWEIRMAGVLHRQFYGVSARTVRGGSGLFGLWNSRYNLFMSMHINAGVWMCLMAIMVHGLWQSRLVRRIAYIPASWFAALITFVAVASMVYTSFFILAIGLFGVYVMRRLPTRLPLILVIAMSFGWIVMRSVDTQSGQRVIDTVRLLVGEGKGKSFEARVRNETLVIVHTHQRPIFGWGSWGGRYRPKGFEAVDGLWVVQLGKFGYVGVLALYAMFLWPIVMILRAWPPKAFMSQSLAPAVILALMLGLFSIHNLFNAMFCEPLIFAAGGLVGISGAYAVARAPRQTAAAAAYPSRGRIADAPA